MNLESTLQEIHDLVEKKIDVSVAQWIDYASHLNLFLMDLDSELIAAEMKVNQFVASLLENSDYTATRAKLMAKSTEDYRRWLELKGKKERAEEAIRLAKKRTQVEPWQR